MKTKQGKASKAKAMADVVATFNESIVEIERAALERYVISFVSDGTPMRTDGKAVRIFGPDIFTCRFPRDAQLLIDGLNKQFAAQDSETRVWLEESAAWKVRRINFLRQYIALVESRNAE